MQQVNLINNGLNVSAIFAVAGVASCYLWSERKSILSLFAVIKREVSMDPWSDLKPYLTHCLTQNQGRTVIS